jgi:hypothetical protein
MFFIESIIVMGTYIEVTNHPVLVKDSQGMFDQVVNGMVDEKWKVRLVKVDWTGLTEIKSDSSYDK